MILTSLPLLLAISFLPPAPQTTPPAPPSYDLQLAPGERLLGYRWDRGAQIPFLADDARVHIVFGERGLVPESRLYLPGQALSEGVATGATTLSSRGLALVDDGRFGRALGFSASTFLRLALPAGDPASTGWTLSFWLRPESAAFGRSFLLLPGAVDLVLQADGHVRASLLPNGGSLTSTPALAAGAWSFVLVSYDPVFTRQLRLFVNGESVRATLPVGALPRRPLELSAGDLGRNGRGFVGALDELSLDPFAQSTAQATRLQQATPSNGDHLLELFTTNGVRTANPAASITTELVLDDAAKFAPGEFHGVAIRGNELTWVPGRWTDLAPRLAPPPRTTHPLVALPGGRVLTIAGEIRDTQFGPMVNTDDTWIFDGGANAWERVQTTTAPSPRCHVPAAYSPDHDLVLFVGGWRNDFTPGATMSDTWVFHVRERRWEQRFPGGNPLFPNSDFGLIYLPALRRFLLIHNQQNSLYDPVADTWQRLPVASAVTASGQPTSYVVGGSAMSALDPVSGLVVVFGGSYGPTQSVFSNTTALYDVNTNTYTVLATATQPSPRVRSGFAYDTRRKVFVLFGGVQNQTSVRNDDLWVFKPSTREWHELGCSNRPTRRGGFFGMAYDERADRFVLYGGRNSVDLWLDDTLALEIETQRSSNALYTFDRGVTPTRNTWFADAVTPGNSGVRFLFRGSQSGAQWSPWTTTTTNLANRRFLQTVAFLTPGSRGEVPTIRRMGFLP